MIQRSVLGSPIATDPVAQRPQPAALTEFPSTALADRTSVGAAAHDLALDGLEGRLRAHAARLGTLAEVARYHLDSGGKRLRGRLALDAGLAIETEPAAALAIATSVELVHHASLVHDDLQDADRQRRGQLSVWARYDKPTALLLGDALLAQAFEELGGLPGSHSGAAVVALSRCITGLARGQHSDGACASGTDRHPAAYEELARAKTGLLFALPLELLALHRFGPGPVASAAASAAALVGVAFQIYDDVADVAGEKGRAVGSDLRCRRFSAVVMHHALAVGPGAIDALRPLPLEKRAELVLTGPGVPRTLDHQSDVLRRAAAEAAALPLPLRGVLASLADCVRERTEALADRRR